MALAPVTAVASVRARGPGFGPGHGGGTGGGAFRVGGGVSAPKAIFAPDPEYSEEARKVKHMGTDSTVAGGWSRRPTARHQSFADFRIGPGRKSHRSGKKLAFRASHERWQARLLHDQREKQFPSILNLPGPFLVLVCSWASRPSVLCAAWPLPPTPSKSPRAALLPPEAPGSHASPSS